VPNSSLDRATQHGVASGSFAVPKNLAAGRYTLVVRSSEAAFQPQRRPLIIQANEAIPAASGRPTAHAPEPDKIDVTFFPEGGQVVAGLENRVYFIARDPAGKPVQLSGTLVGHGHRDDAHDQPPSKRRTKAWALLVSPRGATRRFV
jgi:hypothetical protein